MEELATLDALNCGNPIRELINDVQKGASQIEYFAGLALEVKGEILPTVPDLVNMTVREPYGVCARIVAYNHPLMFAAQRIGAPARHGEHHHPEAAAAGTIVCLSLDGIAGWNRATGRPEYGVGRAHVRRGACHT